MKNFNALIERYKSLTIAGAVELNNEEDVENYIIDKMLQSVWGYDYGPGVDCYKKQVNLPVIGSKGVPPRCDYLLKTNNYSCVIEAKAYTESVENKKHIDELASYVQNLLADVGILTNGKKWALFLAGENHVMESAPFRTFDLDSISEEEKKFVLNLFRKPGASLDIIRSEHAKAKQEAEEKLRLKLITEAIIEERKTLSDDEIKHIIKKVEPTCSMVTQSKIEQYKPFFDNALRNIIEAEKERYRAEVKAEMAKYVNKVEDEEREVYSMVLGLLADQYGDMDIKLCDFSSGVGAKICFNGQNSGQPIIWVCGKIEDNKYKFLGVAFAKTGASTMGDLIPMTSTRDVLGLKDRIRQEAAISAAGPRKESKESPVSPDSV
ncbi:MAG: type I restriction enzyme HsdR N-terminal domain-containing protein [Fibrobacter sp.]|nr:type I restriction enzyme HsdR N-terminal domain-containing protein [Fibrobacter sp.]